MPSNFQKIEKKLAARPGVRSPAAPAATIERRKAAGRGKKRNSPGQPARPSGARSARNLAFEKVEEKQAKAVEFLRRIGDENAADRLDAESPEDYAMRKGIRIDNPAWFGPLTVDDIEGMIREFQGRSDTEDGFPAMKASEEKAMLDRLRQARSAAAAGKAVFADYRPEGWAFRIEANPSSRAGRRKPNQGGSDTALVEAAAVYEAFQGRAPAEVLELAMPHGVPHTYAKLGDLVSLVIQDLDGIEQRIAFSQGDGVIAATTPDKQNIAFIGGNQDVRALLDALGVDTTKELLELGPCLEIEYFTRKAMDKFDPVRYYHEFGEETGDVPVLMFDQRNLQLRLVGGAYYIRPEGIRN